MNTLSAKADSFLEHATYWWRCAPLARSRPCTLKNIPSGVLVPIHHQATVASMNANSQRLRHILTARGTELARVVRGHLDYFTTSSFSFVSEHFDEAQTRPTSAIALASLSIPDHALDVQAFHSDFAVAGNQIIGNFVLMFAAAVGNPSMNASNFGALAFLRFSALLLARRRER